MLVTIGMMVACYGIARLALVTLTQPPGQSRSAAFTVCVIAAMGCIGVGYCASVLLDQGTRDGRPKVEVR
jgi:hypothetical protein